MSTERLEPDEPNPCAPLRREVCEPSPPPLDWGPFGVGMAMALIFLALTVVVPIVFGWGLVELTWVVSIPLTFMCTVSAFGVLYAKRRTWASEQRQEWLAKHGNLSVGD